MKRPPLWMKINIRDGHKACRLWLPLFLLLPLVLVVLLILSPLILIGILILAAGEGGRYMPSLLPTGYSVRCGASRSISRALGNPYISPSYRRLKRRILP